MKWVVYSLLTIAAASGLTLLASQDRGYVLINVAGWSVESSLVTWLVILCIAFAILYVVLRFVGRMWHALPEMKKWQKSRRRERANKALLSGLVKVAQGDWFSAEKTLLKYGADSTDPMLNYLAAARAAHEQNEFDRRDRYLALAGQSTQGTDIAVKLTLAEFQISQHLQEQALATLQSLHQMSPGHVTVIKTLARLYIDMQQWEQFLSLVPGLRKHHLFSTDAINRWERTAYTYLLNVGEAGNATGEKTIESLWYKIPQSVKADQEIIICYVQQLLCYGKSEVSESLIRISVKKQWNDELVRLYGMINGADVSSQLNYAEAWLNDQAHNPVLLLTLGRLSLRNQLWGKARSYFEASIGANGPAEAFNELANLLEKLGELDLALEYYREGLRKTPQCDSTIAAGVNPLEQDHQLADSSPALLNAR